MIAGDARPPPKAATAATSTSTKRTALAATEPTAADAGTRSDRAGTPFRRANHPRGTVERGVAGQDRELELLKRRSRLEAQLLRQHAPEPLENLERLCLPTGSVQRQHELAVEPLPQRVTRDKIAQLADEVARVTKGEIGFHPLLQSGQMKLLDLRDRVAREPLIA